MIPIEIIFKEVFGTKKVEVLSPDRHPQSVKARSLLSFRVSRDLGILE